MQGKSLNINARARFITMVFLLVCHVSDAYSQKTDSRDNVAPGGRQQLKRRLAPEASNSQAIGRVSASSQVRLAIGLAIPKNAELQVFIKDVYDRVSLNSPQIPHAADLCGAVRARGRRLSESDRLGRVAASDERSARTPTGCCSMSPAQRPAWSAHCTSTWRWPGARTNRLFFVRTAILQSTLTFRSRRSPVWTISSGPGTSVAPLPSATIFPVTCARPTHSAATLRATDKPSASLHSTVTNPPT